MKKRILTLGMGVVFATSHLVSLATTPIRPIDQKILTQMNDQEKEATLLAVKERLLEIKSLDKSKLTKAEKEAIKTEKKNAKAIAAGLDRKVSISIGAIIIAILLIILIF